MMRTPASGALLIMLFGLYSVAWGQTVHQAPKGILAGAFYIFPSLELAYKQDDNIFALAENEVEDQVTTARAGLELVSNWSNHFLAIKGNAEMGSYSREKKEDYLDIGFSGSGRIDILRGVYLGLNLGASQTHEERGSPNDLFGSEPARFSLVSGGVSFSHEISVLQLNAAFKADNYAYEDTPTSALIDVDQKGRNRLQIEGTTRLSLVVMGLNSIFVQGKYFARDYEFRDKAAYGFDRNSTGFEVTAGYKRKISDVSMFEIQFGQREQQYVDEDLPDISGVQAAGILKWLPSPMTSIMLHVNRSIEESIMKDVSGYFSTNYGAAIDQEFLSIFLLKASFQRNDLDYHGSDRTDNISSLSAGLYMFMMEYIQIGVSYDYMDRESTDPAMAYQRSVSRVVLTGRI